LTRRHSVRFGALVPTGRQPRLFRRPVPFE
jgi:hypothetical protein